MSFETPTAPYNASDPNATFLSSSCFDFLLIELVPLAYETASATSSSPSITTHHRSGHSNLPNSNSNTNINNGDSISNGNSNGNSKPALDAKLSSAASGGGTTAGVGVSGSSIGAAVTPEDDAQRDIVSKRLDALGYRVGQGIVERFSRDRPRFADALDVIKFVCKDVWMLLFRKQIDNLKTNHRGVYVLTDNTFKPFSRMSMRTSTEALERAQPFLWFPCGIVRGVLASLGIQAVVQAESMELPGAVFQIKTIAAKS